MKPFVRIALAALALVPLAGCWDKAELTEFGYVQAVAIDQNEEGKIALTTHFYNPSGGTSMGETAKQGKKGLNIKTEADTVFDAVRDITIHLGRKAKWDHMRIIVIGEQLARKQHIGEVLDFFSRDHEPRGTVLLLIAEGKAGDYLYVKPFIENTIGEQLRSIEETAQTYTSKTSKVPLLELAIQLKSETNVGIVPFIYKDKSSHALSVAGSAVIQKGYMTDLAVSPSDTQALAMLYDKYDHGIVEFPCIGSTSKSKMSKESYQVTTLQTKMTPIIKGNDISVDVSTQITGSVGELRCSILKTKDEGKQFERMIGKQVEQNMRKIITKSQAKKIDILGIGNRIYRKNPALWKRLKPDWNERFADVRFHIDVQVKLLDTGLNLGTPFRKRGE